MSRLSKPSFSFFFYILHVTLHKTIALLLPNPSPLLMPITFLKQFLRTIERSCSTCFGSMSALVISPSSYILACLSSPSSPPRAQETVDLVAEASRPILHVFVLGKKTEKEKSHGKGKSRGALGKEPRWSLPADFTFSFFAQLNGIDWSSLS